MTSKPSIVSKNALENIKRPSNWQTFWALGLPGAFLLAAGVMGPQFAVWWWMVSPELRVLLGAAFITVGVVAWVLLVSWDRVSVLIGNL